LAAEKLIEQPVKNERLKAGQKKSKKKVARKKKVLSLSQSNDVRLPATNRTFWVTPNPELGAMCSSVAPFFFYENSVANRCR
jgi:hypothetical protein